MSLVISRRLFICVYVFNHQCTTISTVLYVHAHTHTNTHKYTCRQEHTLMLLSTLRCTYTDSKTHTETQHTVCTMRISTTRLSLLLGVDASVAAAASDVDDGVDVFAADVSVADASVADVSVANASAGMDVGVDVGVGMYSKPAVDFGVVASTSRNACDCQM